MTYEIEFTAEFEKWWNSLNADEQESIGFGVRLLQELGPELKRPHADTLKGSAFPNMKELRVQHSGRPFRILFAFDPRRVALLLIGGNKTGKNRFYAEMIAEADAIYTKHLRNLKGMEETHAEKLQ